MSSTILSGFSQIIFCDIRDGYTYQAPLTCQYIVKDSMTVSAEDWVGLYRVGWRYVKDYLCRENCTPLSNADTPGKGMLSVTFKAEDLPRDSEELYQLCYICASSGKVCGASDPFQLKEEVIAADFVEVEGAPSMLMIQTRPTLPSVAVTSHSGSASMHSADFSSKHFENTARVEPIMNGSADKDAERITELCNKYVQEIEELKSSMQKLQLELLNQQEALKHSEEQSCELQDKLNECQKTNTMLKQRIEEFNVALKKNQTDTEASVAQYKSELDKKQMELEAAERECAAKSGELKEAHLRADAAKSAAAAAEHNSAQVQAMNEKINELTEEFRNKECQWLSDEEVYKQQIRKLKVDLENALATAAVVATALHTEPSPAGGLGAGNQAAGGQIQKCQFCDLELPAEIEPTVMQQHLASHEEKICPVCNHIFAPGYDHCAFEAHVQICIDRISSGPS